MLTKERKVNRHEWKPYRKGLDRCPHCTLLRLHKPVNGFGYRDSGKLPGWYEVNDYPACYGYCWYCEQKITLKTRVTDTRWCYQCHLKKEIRTKEEQLKSLKQRLQAIGEKK